MSSVDIGCQMLYGRIYIKNQSLSMRLYGEVFADSIRRIVENVVDWISKANAVYSAHIKRVAHQEKREREEARKNEIAKLDRASSISAILAQI